MNKVILIGHLAKDPEMRHTPSGAAVCSFAIGVSKFTKEEGGKTADFFDVVCWEKKAEFVSKYFRKGSKIALSGRLQQRQWKDKETGANRYAVEIVADELEFADSKGNAEGGNSGGNYGGYAPAPAAALSYNEPSSFQELHDDDGELPF